MDFGTLPPEINSARMYSGPGSGPLLAAATGWQGLAAELDSAAASYGAVISRMTALSWHGPASASMAAAAARYVAWINTTAAQAEQTANQARAAAAAYEAAFAATVPPPVVAANRSRLSSLIATNILGQNTLAIAATEAQYAEMWAQDAMAMYGYAGASAIATRLTPFSEPAQTTDQGGLAAQAAAVGQAIATQAGTSAPEAAAAAPELTLTPDAISITSIFTSINQALQQLSSGALASPLNPYNWWIVQQFANLNVTNRTALSRGTVGLAYFSTGIMSFFGSIAQQTTFGPGGATAGAGGAWYATPQFAGLHLGAVAGGAGSHAGGRRICPRPPRSGGCRCRRLGPAHPARSRSRPPRRLPSTTPPTRTARPAGCCAACPWAPAADAPAPRGRPANMASDAACSPVHHRPDNANVQRQSRSATQPTESHAIRLAPPRAIAQRDKRSKGRDE